MSDIEQFPRLEFEASTTFQSDIEELFSKVKHLHLAWKAKQILYPLREDYKDLFIGGGANHIWFHHNENGQMSDDRIAIIHFDPYYDAN